MIKIKNQLNDKLIKLKLLDQINILFKTDPI